MATENKRLNVKPILWSTADKTFVPASGEIWYYYETAGSILSVVGDGSSTVQQLRVGAYILQVDGLGLNADRFAIKESLPIELTDGDGDYVIAETSLNTFAASSSIFTVLMQGGIAGVITFRASMADSGNTAKNPKIEILQDSWYNGDRKISPSIGYSPTGGGTGANIVLSIVGTSGQSITVQKHGNIGQSSEPGFQLITPELSTGLLPDGVTTATFIEAGAELASISTGTFPDSRFTAFAQSTTSLRVSLFFDEIPKQGTTITFPTSFNFRQSDGTTIYSVSTAESISIDNISGNVITCIITTTGLTVDTSGIGVGADFSAVIS